ncbi:MAG: hypothetical protein B6244_06910 [Candidatus Cloacimonetes bacterium 4572_55]|nr:MAG: hypothetical protein B6244_06910 [Candidatus Cloacimonetes bacterium 4572_55]
MKRIVFFCLSLCLIFISNASAQVSSGGVPPSFDLSLRTDMDSYTLPVVNVDSLIALDEIEQAENLPHRFGMPFDVNLTLQNSGTWDILEDGSRIWRLWIEAPGAYTINLRYDVYWLPEGAKFFIYNEDQSMVIGAFTHRNNTESGYFGTSFVKGSVSVLEYYEPAHVSQPGQIEISRIVHGYKDLFHELRNFGDSGACNINVICDQADDWREDLKATALLVSSSGFRFCTGSLINNVTQDQTPYFLTANHCGVSVGDLAVFNYESTSCPYPGVDGNLAHSAAIISLFASGSASDYSLSLLEDLPDDYDVYFSGWDANDTPAQSSTGIHHPSGDVKKICFDYDAATHTSWGGTPPNSHWQVNWDDGTTEPGSSGSPLYDQNHRLIGQLHGGTAACSGTQPNGQPDQYGKFSLTFPNIQQWLDPDNTGVLVLDGRGMDQVYFVGMVSSNDAIGDPLPGVSVWAENPSGVIFDALTDVDGLYTIEVEPDASYTLYARTLGYSLFQSDMFEIPDADTTIAVNMALDLTGPAPENVVAESNLNSLIPVSWDPVTSETPECYNLYRSELTDDDYQLLAECLDATEYNDGDVINGREYFYKTTALYENPEGESFYSEQANAIPGEVIQLPYETDFEADQGGMYDVVIEEGDGTGHWEYGAPGSDHGPGAAYSGSHLWATGLAENYGLGIDVYLLTSLIDLTSVNQAWLSFKHWYVFEGTQTRGFDGGNVAASTDGGYNWIVMHPQGDYQDQSIPSLDQEPGYSGTSEGWETANFDLSEFLGSVIAIRFRAASDPGISKAGWFIDNLLLDETIGIENEEGEIGSQRHTLSQNYPNPFNPNTTITFRLPTEERVSLKVYNISGRLVTTLVDNAVMIAGTHTVNWSGRNDKNESVGSGVYLYTMQTETFRKSRRMALLK